MAEPRARRLLALPAIDRHHQEHHARSHVQCHRKRPGTGHAAIVQMNLPALAGSKTHLRLTERKEHMGQYLSRFFFFCLMLAGGFLPATAAPDTLPSGIVQGPSVEGTSQYTLPNGLRVLLTPDPSKPNVTVNMTYLVGSRHENYGQTGMAHLLEHMLFRGTPSLP